MHTPFPQSYWVHEGLLCAGCYPGAPEPVQHEAMIRGLVDTGIRRVMSLMEATEKAHGGREFVPYRPLMQQLAAARGMTVEFLNLPIRDATAPSHSRMHEILDAIEAGLASQAPTYVHCWGGHGRTSTVVACHLIRRGASPEEAIAAVLDHRRDLPKNHHPFEGPQEDFVRSWTGDLPPPAFPA